MELSEQGFLLKGEQSLAGCSPGMRERITLSPWLMFIYVMNKCHKLVGFTFSGHYLLPSVFLSCLP